MATADTAMSEEATGGKKMHETGGADGSIIKMER